MYQSLARSDTELEKILDIFEAANQTPENLTKLVLDLTKSEGKALLRKLVDGEVGEAQKLVSTFRKVIEAPQVLRTNPKFLENITDFPANRINELNADLANPKWKDELTELFDESPNDVKDIWNELKERPDYHFEIKSSEGFADQSRWQKWSQREFFKEATKKGIAFEKSLLDAVRNRAGEAYQKLKQFVPDLDQRRLLSQIQFCLPGLTPPCNKKGEYFIADQVWVKYDEFGDVQDIVIIDAKLSQGTGFSTGQNAAKNHVGGELSYKPANPLNIDEMGKQLPSNINQGQLITVNSFYKLFGDGESKFLDIE